MRVASGRGAEWKQARTVAAVAADRHAPGLNLRDRLGAVVRPVNDPMGVDGQAGAVTAHLPAQQFGGIANIFLAIGERDFAAVDFPAALADVLRNFLLVDRLPSR